MMMHGDSIGVLYSAFQTLLRPNQTSNTIQLAIAMEYTYLGVAKYLTRFVELNAPNFPHNSHYEFSFPLIGQSMTLLPALRFVL